MDSVEVNVLATRLSDIRELHKVLLSNYRAIDTSVRSGDLKPEVMSDIAFLLGELSELLEDLRKESDALEETTGDLAALAWTLDPTASGPIEGDRSIGKVVQKVYPKLPSKKQEPERHQRLMLALGLTAGADGNLFSISWPRLVERLSADYAAGKPMPDGIAPEDLHMKPKLQTRRKGPKHLED